MPTWFRNLLVAVPGLVLVGLIVVRVVNPPAPKMPHRDLSAPSQNDPALLVPAYSNLVARLQRAEFVPTAEFSAEHLGRLLPPAAEMLTPVQRTLLLSSILDLIDAHHKGDSTPLHRLLFPSGGEAGIGWSAYGRRRLAIILAAAGHGSRKIDDLLEPPAWGSVEQAWTQMVTEYRLTNWWSRLSPEQSAVWLHQEKLENLPALDAPLFGEFAGTVMGPSLIARALPQAMPTEPPAPITAATVRVLVGFPQREKPVIYLFRWWWSQSDQVWYPMERLIGVVGDRFPDPFF